jgi:phosphohistidine swiveling domain-containing protein
LTFQTPQHQESTVAEEPWIIDTKPSLRFPVYTRMNANDVLPDPITPLGASLCWDPHILSGWVVGYAATGAFTLAELSVDEPPSGAFFYGHLYANASAARLLGIRSGLPAEAVDRIFFGAHPDMPPHAPREDDVNPALSEKLGERTAWVLSTESYPELEEERQLADRLRDERPDLASMSALALVGRARSVMPLERVTWRGEVGATNGSSVGPAVLADLLGPDQNGLVLQVTGHAGDVDSAAPSYALWMLSRIVRDDARLTAEFDRGIPGLAGRLPAADEAFARQFNGFLRDFGYRGPSEWDLGSDSWETRPELPLALIDRLRQLGPEGAPPPREDGQSAETQAAMTTALALVGDDPERVALFHAALASARRFGAWRERAKTNCIKVLHEGRMALNELAQRLYAEGRLESPRHLFMATDDELDIVALEPESIAPVLAAREKEWLGLFGLELPMWLDASKPLPPLSSLKHRSETLSETARSGDVLQGVGASAGIGEGRARVILSMDAIGDFEPGEVLVAPQTDPSWTPLFMLSAATVVDVGAAGSHAMIVSRELGIPCAAGVTGASARIRTGALVRVDGSTGTVTVLES